MRLKEKWCGLFTALFKPFTLFEKKLILNVHYIISQFSCSNKEEVLKMNIDSLYTLSQMKTRTCSAYSSI